MTDPDDLLLSDSERLHALMALGDHYASGRLDDTEFHARSGEVAASRTLGQLRGSFADLPGGTPLTSVDGMIVQSATATGGELEVSSSSSSSSSSSTSSALSPGSPTGAGTPAARGTDADLEDLRRRGKLVESLDGVVIGLTLITFLVLQIIVDWQYAWMVWPSLVLTLGLPRLVLRYTDSDEKTYEKLKKADERAREERLRAATERIRELGDGRENRD